MSFDFQVTIEVGDDDPIDITPDVIEVRWSLGLVEPYQEFGDDYGCEIDLDNSDGTYTPESAWSSLAGILAAGVTVKVYLILNGTSTQMWTGVSRELDIKTDEPGPAFASIVTLVCSGPYDFFRDLTAVGPFGTNKDTGALIKIALANAGFTDYTNIQTGQKTIADFANQLNDMSILNAMMALTQVERGKFFFDRTLLPTFWDRHYLFKNSQTSVLTVDSDEPAPARPYALDYRHNSETASRVRITINPTTTAASSETLWELDSTLEVGAGDIETYEIELRRAASQQVGRSTALSSSGATWATSTTATITVTGYGSRADLKLDNSANALPATLTTLTITGTPTVSQSAITYELATGLSSTRIFTMSIPALADAEDGRYIAQFEAGRRGTVRGTVYYVEFLHYGDGDNNAHHIQDFGARISMNLRKLNHTADYYMIGEEHAVRADRYHWTRLYLEPADSQQYWLLGTAGFSELDNTTVLGY